MTKRVLDPDGTLGFATLVTEEFFYDGSELVHTRSSVAGESHYYLIDPNTGDVRFDQKRIAVYTTLADHLGTLQPVATACDRAILTICEAFPARAASSYPIVEVHHAYAHRSTTIPLHRRGAWICIRRRGTAADTKPAGESSDSSG
jgi:hypothetical protein